MLKKVEKDKADNSVNDMKPCKLNDQDCVRLQTTSEVSKICILPVWEIKLKKNATPEDAMDIGYLKVLCYL